MTVAKPGFDRRSAPRAGGRARRATRLAVMLLLGACYSYSPPGGASPKPGAHVAIHLYRDAADSLALELGPGVAYVEGVVIGDDSTGLQLAVSHVEGAGASGSVWTGERFTFPHGLYGGVQERHLSLPGTVLLGGLAVGGVVALYNAFGSPASSGPQSGGIVAPTQ